MADNVGSGNYSDWVFILSVPRAVAAGVLAASGKKTQSLLLPVLTRLIFLGL